MRWPLLRNAQQRLRPRLSRAHWCARATAALHPFTSHPSTSPVRLAFATAAGQAKEAAATAAQASYTSYSAPGGSRPLDGNAPAAEVVPLVDNQAMYSDATTSAIAAVAATAGIQTTMPPLQTSIAVAVPLPADANNGMPMVPVASVIEDRWARTYNELYECILLAGLPLPDHSVDAQGSAGSGMWINPMALAMDDDLD